MTTVAEHIAEVRARLDDQVEPYLWADSEILRALNQALREFGLRQPVLDDSTWLDIPITPHEYRYEYDPHILYVERVLLNGDDVPKVRLTQFMPDSDQWCYAEQWQARELLLSPTPSGGALSLVAYRIPRCNYTTDNMDVAINDPDPLLYHEAIQTGVMAYLYTKHDADTFGVDDQHRYRELFNQMVGHPLTARQIEARRENTNLRLYYRGTPYTERVKHPRRYRHG